MLSSNNICQLTWGAPGRGSRRVVAVAAFVLLALFTIQAQAQSDPPVIAIDGYEGQVSGTTECAATTAIDKTGVCEGDAIIFTISSTPAPSEEITVRIGRLSAGRITSGYGLTNPHDYLPDAYAQGPDYLTIPANQSTITYTVPVNNEYGNYGIGGYYIEVVCLVDPPPGDNSRHCLADVTGLTYQFVAETRGGSEARLTTPNNNCNGGVDGDGDEPSECLALIQSVPSPTISIAAISTDPLTEGDDAVFSITSTTVPNHYEAGQRAAQPITLTIAEQGEITTEALGDRTVNLPVADTTATFTITTTADTTGWDGPNPALIVSVAESPEDPDRYTRNANASSVTLAVTDDETITLTMGANPAATEGEDMVFTVIATGAALEADLTHTYEVSGTATEGADFTPPSGTITLPANTSTATITATTLVDSEVDAGETIILTLSSTALPQGTSIGSPAAATGTISADTPPEISITGGNPVAELIPAEFTVSSNRLLRTELIVTVEAANATGTFLGASPPTTVTMAMDTSSATIEVPTIQAGGTVTLTDGSITVTVQDGARYNLISGETVATVTIRDIPFITLDFMGKASGTKQCPEAKGDNKNGICEGDIMAIAVTATPAPNTSNPLSVRLYRQPAGARGVDFFSLHEPFNYQDAADTVSNAFVTIPTGGTHIHEVAASNEYGGENSGAYFVQVICYASGPDPNAVGEEGGCFFNREGHNATITPYRFIGRTKGSDQGAMLTGPCSRSVGGDGDEPSECLMDIHSVAPPTLSVSPVESSVGAGTNALFTITADKTANYYVAEARAGLPIEITVSQTGDSLATGSAPTTITLGAVATTAILTLTTQAGDSGDGTITFALGSGTGYTVGSVSAATITVAGTVASVSSKPGVDLATASDSRPGDVALGPGDDMDNITNDDTPTITVTNVVNTAALTLVATHTDMSTVTVTATATGASQDVDFTTLKDGVWSIVVTHAEISKTTADSDALSITIDATAPVVTLVKNPERSPAMLKVYSATQDDADAIMKVTYQGETTCPAAPSSADDYTSGDDITRDMEDQNGDYICFYSTDRAGNSDVKISNQIGDIDVTAPTITLATAGINLITGAATTVTITFSESTVTDLVVGNITNSGGGTLGSLTKTPGSEVEYTATFTAGAIPVNVTLSVAASTFTDPAGNSNTASNMLEIIVVGMVIINPPEKPILDLAMASDSRPDHGALGPGDDTDNITNDNTPTITVTGVVNAAALVVVATHTDATMVTVTATVAGTSQDVDFTTLKDGVWSVVATHTESGSSTGTDSDALSVTIDTVAPVIMLVKNPDKSPAMLKVYSATHDDTDATMKVRYQKETTCPAAPPSIDSYTSGDDVTRDMENQNGDYICFYSTDRAGNSDVEVANQVGGIDVTAPTITLAAADTTLTAGATTTITITTSESTATDLVVGNITVSGGTLGSLTKTSGSEIEYTATFTAGANPGTASLSVAASTFTDVAGNNNTASNVLEITIEAAVVSPSAKPTVDLAAASDSSPGDGALGPGNDMDNITNDDTPTITVTDVVDTAELTLVATHTDATAVTVTATVAGTSQDIDFTTLKDGVWSVVATHTETNKTATDSDALSVTIDTTAPVVTLVKNPDKSPAMSKVYSATHDDTDATMKVRYQDETTCPAAPSVTTNYTSGADVTRDMEDQNDGYICFYSTDRAGNSNVEIANQVGGIDLTTPTITLAAADTSITTGATTTITITTSESTATDLVVGNITVSGGGTLGSLTKTSGSEVEYTATFTAGANPAIASLSVAASTFTDVAGNNNTASNVLEITVEAVVVSPSAKPIVDLAAASDSRPGHGALGPGDDMDNITNDDTPTITVTDVVDTAALTLVATHTDMTAVTVTATATGTSQDVDFTTLKDGVWSVIATHTEPGKTATDSDALSVTIDTTAPIVMLVKNPDKSPAMSKVYSATQDDTDAIMKVTYQDETTCPAAPSATTGYTSGADVTRDMEDQNDGYICFYSTDRAGNSDVEIANQVGGIDVTAPTITLAAADTSITTGATTTITITTSESTATNLVVGNITVSGGTLGSLTKTSGSEIEYTATFTASANPGTASLFVAASTFTDVAGNNNTASNVLKITVEAAVVSPSAKPTVDLAAASDSSPGDAALGPGDDTDNITNDDTPIITVTDVVSGASVVVVATHTDATTVTSTVASATSTSADVTFTTLKDGVWSIVATHAESSKTATDSDALSVTIDTTAPVVMLVKNPDKSPAMSKVYSATQDDADAIMKVTYQGETTCLAAPSATTNYTSGADVTRDMEDQNDGYICFYSTDRAGNSDVEVANQVGGIDVTAPTITLAAADTSITTGATTTITITTSESTATDLVVGNITVSGGTLGSLTKTSGSEVEYTATFTASANPAMASLSVAASLVMDAAGNNNTASNVLEITVEAVVVSPSAKPTVALADASNGGVNTDTTTNDDTPTITVTDVIDTAALTLVATHTDATAVTITATVAGTSQDVDFTMLKDGVWSIVATHTEPSKTTTDSDALSVTIDTTAPTITLAAVDSSITTGTTTTITITTSEATATDLVVANITISGGGTLGSLTKTPGSEVEYTATFTAGANPATASLSVAASIFTDVAGNNNTASNVLEITIEAVVVSPSAKPTVDLAAASDSSPGDAALGPGDDTDNITNDDTPTIMVTDVVDTATLILVATHTDMTAITVTATVAGTNQDVDFTTLKDGVWSVVATHTEPSKTATDSDVLSVTIDTTAPIVTLVKNPDKSPAMSKVYSATHDDTDATMKVRYQDETICPAAPSATTSYTSGTDVTRDMEDQNGGYICFYSTDRAGNSDVEIANQVGGIDITAPTITLAAADTSITTGATTTITITASESTATDLTVGNITVSGGTLGTDFTKTSGSDVEYTVTFTAGSSATTASLSVAASTFTDVAGNNNTASNVLEITVEAAVVSPSAKPIVDLAATSDSRPGHGALGPGDDMDNITNDDAPTITVTDVVNGASVIVVATHADATTVTSTVASATSTSADVTFTTLKDGVWSVVATHTEASKTATDSDALSVTIDTTAPAVTLVKNPDKSPAMSKVYSATQDDTDATMKVRYQDETTCPAAPSATTNYTSGADVTRDMEDQNDGYICFYSTDRAGNSDVEIANQVGGIDVTAPTVTLAVADTSITTGATTIITITTSESTATDLVVGNITVSGGTLGSLAKTSGSEVEYTATFTAGANPATASLSVAASTFTDVAGNNNTASNMLEITVEAAVISPSAKPIVDLAAASDSRPGHGALGPGDDTDNITNDDTPTITIIDVVSGASVIVIATHTDATTVTSTVASATSTSADVTFTTLKDGVWSVVATHTEPSKMATDSDALSVTIDTTAPAVTLVKNPDKSPAMSKVYSATHDDTDATMKVRYQDETTCPVAPSATTNYTSGADVTRDMEDQNDGYICFYSTDRAGNSDVEIANQVGGIDVTAPTITLAAADTTLTTSATTTITITTSESTATNLVVGNITVSGGTLGTDFTKTSGSDVEYTVTFTAGSSATTASLSVATSLVMDAAGNNNTASNVLEINVEAVVINPSAKPTVDLATASDSRPGHGALGPGDDMDDITNDDTPTITVTDVVNGALVAVVATHTDATTVTSTVASATSTSADVTFTTLKDGVWSIVATHIEASKTATDSDALSVTIDTNAPIVTLVKNPDQSPAMSKVYSATHNDTDATMKVRYQDETTCPAAPSATTNYTSGVDVTRDMEDQNDGYICFYSTDRAGNSDVEIANQVGGIDVTAPTIVVNAGESTLTTGATTTITITTSESTATDLVVGNITVSGGTLGSLTKTSGSEVEYTTTFTAGANPATASLSVAASTFTDVAGNNNTASNVLEITIEAVVVSPSEKPTVDLAAASDSRPGHGALGPGDDTDNITSDDTPTITITDVVDTAELILVATHTDMTAITVTATAAGTSQDIDFTTLKDGVWSVVATHTEASKTATDSDALSVTIDTTAPAVTLVKNPDKSPAMSKIYSATQDDTDATMKVRYQDETTCPAAPSTTVNYTSGADVTRDMENQNDGYICFYSTDRAGNGNVEIANQIGGIDVTAPTIIVSAGVSTLTTGATTTITITTSEATATDLTIASITISGGTLGSLTKTSGSEVEYTATFTAGANPATASLSVATSTFTDVAGNNNTASNVLAITVEAVVISPSAKPIVALADASNGGVNTDTITNDDTPTITVTDVVDAAMLTLVATHTDATAVTVTATVAGTSQDVDFTTLKDGVWSVVATHTESGKTATDSDALSVTIDTTVPTITLTATDASITTGATTTITITTSEATATDLTIASITISGGGTLGSLTKTSGSEVEYTATFTAGANPATASLSVATNTFTDIAGNNNTASNTLEITITRSTPPPTISITAPASINEGDAVTFIVSLTSAEAIAINIPVTITAIPMNSTTGTLPTSVQIPAGNTSASFTVATAENEIDGSGSTLRATISNPPGTPYQVLTATANVTITDDDDPPEVSFANTNFEGGEGEPVNFTITLTLPSDKTITINYTTSDGTATAGLDYTTTSDSVTFQPGESTKNVPVPTLSDELDEDPDETFTLHLLSANNATLTGSPFATGTIAEIRVDMQQTNQHILPDVAVAITDINLGTVQGRVEDALNRPRPTTSGLQIRGNNIGQFLASLARDPADNNSQGGWHNLNLLPGDFSFNLPLADNANTTPANLNNNRHTSIWARGHTRKLSLDNSEIKYDTSIKGAMIGFDISSPSGVVVGLGVSHSIAETEYDTRVRGGTGIHEANITSIHPYIGLQLGESGSHIWATLGIGEGDIKAVTNDNKNAYTSDIETQSVSLGGYSPIFIFGGENATTRIGIIGDGLLARTSESDNTSTGPLTRTPESDNTALNVRDGRVRLGFELKRQRNKNTAGLYSSSLEITYRRDFGDDSREDTGIEIGGGLDFLTGNLQIDMDARTLLMNDDFKDWGLSLGIAWTSGLNNRGLSLSFRPQWGTTADQSGAFWQSEMDYSHYENTPTTAALSYTLELKYGIPLTLQQNKTLLQLFARNTAHNTTQTYNLGADLTLGQHLSLGYQTTLQQPTPSPHNFYIRYHKRF
ncbi:MAG: Ig-like domain-containing protein [Pseudohongiellaceae bacterium]